MVGCAPSHASDPLASTSTSSTSSTTTTSTPGTSPLAGLRPMMPTMLPRVGAGKAPGVFYNTGHGHLGWTLSAATAEMVGEAVRAGMRKSKLDNSPAVAMTNQ